MAFPSSDPDSGIIEGKQIGLMGFPLGGYWSLWLAEEQPQALAATAIFYGTRGGTYQVSTAAFLGYFAETDEYVSASGGRKLEKTLKATGAVVTFYSYPDTQHWFFENDRLEHNPQAAQLAWQCTLEFMKMHLS